MEAKISDFGTVKTMEERTSTKGTPIAYTLRYVSPETLLNNITSFTSDIWSFGLICYELMTGY